MSILTADKVTELFAYVHDDHGAIEEKIFDRTYRFDAVRLADNQDIIREMLLELPREFMKTGGGGWSFLNACNDKHGCQWTGLHQTMAQLFLLGMTIRMVVPTLPPELTDILPGGVPYFTILDNQKDIVVLIFVDVEARGASPATGVMTEFGAVDYGSRQVFHGVLYDSEPDPDNPAIPRLIEGGNTYDISGIMDAFAEWIKQISGKSRPVFVSDNPAYDWQWINYYFDLYGIDNPFGYSARRISDFYAGLTGKWKNTQTWKRYRVTPHDHNPVNDSMGNVEAFETIVKQYGVQL